MMNPSTQQFNYIKFYSCIKSNKALNISEKVILCDLINISKCSYCRPSINYLSDLNGMCEKSVRNAMKTLKDIGLVESSKTYQKAICGRKQNSYVVYWEDYSIWQATDKEQMKQAVFRYKEKLQKHDESNTNSFCDDSNSNTIYNNNSGAMFQVW